MEEIAALGLPNVETDANYQPLIEDAAQISEFDLVFFLDTTVEQVDDFSVRRLEPAKKISFTSHHVSPESVLAMCEEMYGRAPESWRGDGMTSFSRP